MQPCIDSAACKTNYFIYYILNKIINPIRATQQSLPIIPVQAWRRPLFDHVHGQNLSRRRSGQVYFHFDPYSQNLMYQATHKIAKPTLSFDGISTFCPPSTATIPLHSSSHPLPPIESIPRSIREIRPRVHEQPADRGVKYDYSI